jgi:hypothetical protein
MAPNDWPFYAGQVYASRAQAPFRVTPAGEMWATNAHITGEIDANSGYLGALTVNGMITVGAGGSIAGTGYTLSQLGLSLALGLTEGTHGVNFYGFTNYIGHVFTTKADLATECEVHLRGNEDQASSRYALVSLESRDYGAAGITGKVTLDGGTPLHIYGSADTSTSFLDSDRGVLRFTKAGLVMESDAGVIKGVWKQTTGSFMSRGSVTLRSAVDATAESPLQNSGTIYLQPQYYAGGAAQNYNFGIRGVMDAVTPTAHFSFINNAATEIMMLNQAGNLTLIGAATVGGAADAKQLIVKGNAAQSLNLQEWQSSAGVVLADVSSTGMVRTWRGIDGGYSPIYGNQDPSPAYQKEFYLPRWPNLIAFLEQDFQDEAYWLDKRANSTTVTPAQSG